MDISYIFIKNEDEQPSDYGKLHQMIGTEESVTNYNIKKNGDRQKISDYIKSMDGCPKVIKEKIIEEEEKGNKIEITLRKDEPSFREVKEKEKAVLIDVIDNRVSIIEFKGGLIIQPEIKKEGNEPKGYLEFIVVEFFEKRLDLDELIKTDPYVARRFKTQVNGKIKDKYGFTLISLKKEELRNLKQGIEGKIERYKKYNQ